MKTVTYDIQIDNVVQTTGRRRRRRSNEAINSWSIFKVSIYQIYNVNCHSACIILDTTLKDPRLHALVTSIRGALRRGFTNGQMKTVTYDIVKVVQTTGLCPKHSLSLNVLAAYLFFVFKSCMFCYSSTEYGGIHVKLSILDIDHCDDNFATTSSTELPHRTLSLYK